MSFGNTGPIKPTVSMSSVTVTRMNVTAALPVAFTMGLLATAMFVAKRETEFFSGVRTMLLKAAYGRNVFVT
jgi:hypothetical protein